MRISQNEKLLATLILLSIFLIFLQSVSFKEYVSAQDSIKCYICGKDIPPDKLHELPSDITGERKFYCDNCFKTLPMCFFCGLLVKPGILPLSDGRHICADCLKNAVIEYKDVKAIYDEVVAISYRFLERRIKFVPPLYIINQKQYKEHKERCSGSKPFTIFDLGYYNCDRQIYVNGIIEARNPVICVIYGLPKDEMFDVVAHEFGHAWYFENCPPNQSEEIVEGFAQWVAYKEMIIKGDYNREINIQLKRDDVYGTGLRKFISIENSGGISAVLKYVKAQGYTR
ncbi:MAG: protein DA1 [Firmicutes bacterium]|nr:protein DA1 [Bacillota bacterium]